jgi:serine/threonine protein kinase
MSNQLPRLTEHGYDVISYLGKGSEGAVFKARYLGREAKGDLQPNQDVAIKITPCDKVRPNEVLLQARIQHINVIRLYDVFRCVSWRHYTVAKPQG